MDRSYQELSIPLYDPSNHTDKNIQSVNHSVRPNIFTFEVILIWCTGIEGLPEARKTTPTYLPEK
ncbi:hypothetical protein OUZ56_011753 [Daphnia magna]|uniref:Uncharacterized protein n=1 Tax=Daphnia magna TaxID=35525 RepID=A0ABQ9Z175_9CRUS|nr:hypothetical protein OUZ56_011753 [Daphnia magna]